MELLTLTDGPTLPVEVIHLAIDLEIRGFVLHAEGPILRVTTKGATQRDSLAQQDREAIKKWKQHLLVVVEYCEHHKFQEVAPQEDFSKVSKTLGNPVLGRDTETRHRGSK